jgi:hypothetical protein
MKKVTVADCLRSSIDGISFEKEIVSRKYDKASRNLSGGLN